MSRVRLATDDLEAAWPARLRGGRVGALLHPASVNSRLVHTVETLERLNGSLFKLETLFGPQHGFLGQTQDNMIEWESFTHPRLGIPVYSLYGEVREPTPDMLETTDVLLVDLQEVGARYYTFIWSLYLCMKVCAREGRKVVVVDRPNPINGVVTEGPVLDPAYSSFVGFHPIPVRHGLTVGELARLFRREVFTDCELEILPMQAWKREMWYDETGLPWAMPSPNMPTLDTATVYPGMCLLEGTNLSEGRGTTRPFEIFGAPFLEAGRLAGEVNSMGLAGVYLRELSFQPTFGKYAGQLCHGAQLHVTDRGRFRSYDTALHLLEWISRHYPEQFRWNDPPYEYEYEKLPIEVLTGGPVDAVFRPLASEEK